MKLFESIPFTFAKDDFEIRILYDATVVNVVAFLNGFPANGYRYQIKIPKGRNVKNILKNHPVPELVDACKNNIKEKKWGALHKVIQEY